MKILKQITSLIIFMLVIGVGNTYASNATGGGATNTTTTPANPPANIVEIENNMDSGSNNRTVIKNKFDELYKAGEKDGENRLASLSDEGGGTDSINNFLLNIAKSLKDLFMVILSVYLIVGVIRMLLAESSQDEFDKLKTSLIWVSVGIILMQVSYRLVLSVYDRDIGSGLGGIVLQSIINPLINMILYITGFLFMFAAVFSFYKLITSDGDESRGTEGKMGIFYAVIGVIVVKISQTIIRIFYGDVYTCTGGPKCDLIAGNSNRSQIGGTEGGDIGFFSTYVDVIVAIINWANGFISIIVVILIIYAGAMVLFSNGNSENLEKAKRSLIYIFLGLFIIVASYFILDFFIIDKAHKIS